MHLLELRQSTFQRYGYEFRNDGTMSRSDMLLQGQSPLQTHRGRIEGLPMHPTCQQSQKSYTQV
jgi:hypothetical protein